MGLDGLEPVDGPPEDERVGLPALALSADAAAVVRQEVARAGGREVCFLAAVDEARQVVRPRVVARGNHEAVVAAARDADQGALMIHNHPSGVLDPSQADLAVATKVWEEGLGTAITDNEASGLYVVVEPPEPRVRHPLDVTALEAVLAPGGALAEMHPGFEDRPGQREMLRLVSNTYEAGGVAVVEAGTGTGKSLAYLLPAAAWAQLNRERTVVSTNTINLQEQLAGKDLPLVRRLLGDDVEWTLVKGRGNYVSIRRARLAAESAPSLFVEERQEELRQLFEWALRTDDGSLGDLPRPPSVEAWEEVRSDPDVCLRARCPHFAECFYQRSRREAAKARILVVNHHLLFADVAVRRATGNYRQAAVLPPYRHLVLDEAHNLEDAATAHLGVDVSRVGLSRLFSRLDRKGKGLLTALNTALASEGSRSSELRVRLDGRVTPALEDARDACGELLDALEERLPEGLTGAARLGPTGELGEPGLDPVVAEMLARALMELGRLEREVEELRRRIQSDEVFQDALEGRVLDLQSVERRLAAAAHGLRLVLDPVDEEGPFVRWLERRRRVGRREIALAAAPVEPGVVLRESLFAKLDTAVLTSATLSTRRRFDFFRRRVGLAADDAQSLQEPLVVVETLLPSPFDFSRQTVLAVPTDLPDASGGGSPELNAETARIVRSVAELTAGGLFVLFTSHRALRDVAERLRASGVERSWPLFVHGEDGRARLLERFTASGQGILLGTTSFWEGVDVPGHPLRGLVIQKLPFRVPTDPVTAARLEAVQRTGGDGFTEFLLPLAALRLKQGFGRLVRSRHDRGAVVLLDDRIVRRRYGRYLRDSLPEAPFAKGPWDELRHTLRRFYEVS